MPGHPTTGLGFLPLQGPLPLLLACLFGAITSSSYNNMVVLALPSIGQVLGVDLTLVQWVVLVYLLTNSSTIAISGRLGDMFGARRLYRVGLVLFALAGLACAAAPSLLTLLAARSLQALGTGMFVVAVPAILTDAFPEHQRGRVIGLYGTAVFVGLAIGPLLGGVLTEWLGWRAVFGATVFIAGLALWLAWRHVPLERAPQRSGSFDPLGSLAYVATLVPLLLALSRARQWGLGSPLVLGLLLLGTAAASLFLYVERRAASPLLDLRLFSSRYFSLSALASLGVFVAYYPLLVLVPFYLVQARGVSPGVAGLLVSALPISMVLVASLAGLLADRFTPTVPATIGPVLIGSALLVLSQLGPDTAYPYIALSVALVGAGAGLGDVANVAALMGAAPHSRRGMASASVATTRYVGQALGVAMASTVFALTAGPEVGPQSWPGFAAAFLAMSAAAALSAIASLARGRPSAATQSS